MTSWALTVAAALCLVLAVGPSFLGERCILIRLFRRHDLPHHAGISDLPAIDAGGVRRNRQGLPHSPLACSQRRPATPSTSRARPPP